MNLLLAVACLAVWSDDFDGTTLQSHWAFYTEGGSLSYSVSGGYLNVTGVSGPFRPDQVKMYAQVGSFQDFVATALVEWNPGRLQALAFEVQTQYPIFVPRFAEIRYTASRGNRVIATLPGVQRGGRGAQSGAHEFRLTRSGSTMNAFFDGRLIASTSSAPLNPVTYVAFIFEGDESGGFGGFRINRVAIEDVSPTMSALIAGYEVE